MTDKRSSGWATDEPITQAIEREIQARMQPGARPIDVSAQGGSVTLTGHVANQATKEALIQLAHGTAGVIDVTDNLVIGGGHPFLDWFFPGRNPNQDLDDVDRDA
ncbi:MAG: BON domain-containing protein [Chloroflexota bacterium]|nr:BON domain-containing protein [Chloroflexota bacterium]